MSNTNMPVKMFQAAFVNNITEVYIQAIQIGKPVK